MVTDPPRMAEIHEIAISRLSRSHALFERYMRYLSQRTPEGKDRSTMRGEVVDFLHIPSHIDLLKTMSSRYSLIVTRPVICCHLLSYGYLPPSSRRDSCKNAN